MIAHSLKWSFISLFFVQGRVSTTRYENYHENCGDYRNFLIYLHRNFIKIWNILMNFYVRVNFFKFILFFLSIFLVSALKIYQLE